jgi:adenosylhomocysteine nucleosidase
MVPHEGSRVKLLFIASDPMEFRGLLAHATAIREAEVAVHWSRSATLHGNRILLVANGAGPCRAAAATDAGMKAFDAQAIVSTGFCGALSPDLRIADLVSATMCDRPPGLSSARCAAGAYAAQTAEEKRNLAGAAAQVAQGHALPIWPYAPEPLASATQAMSPRHFAGPIRSIPYVAQSAEEKRNLAVTGAIAVEMEAAGVAERAESHGLPLYCVRAVTDLATEDLANNFNKALRLDGRFDTILILKGSLRNPMVRLPELLRLRKRCARAAQVLGEFFADSRI